MTLYLPSNQSSSFNYKNNNMAHRGIEAAVTTSLFIEYGSLQTKSVYRPGVFFISG